MGTIHGYPLDHGLDYGLRVPWIGLDLDWPFLNGYPSIENTGFSRTENFKLRQCGAGSSFV